MKSIEEVLSKHVSKECLDELSVNIWPDLIEAVREYGEIVLDEAVVEVESVDSFDPIAEILLKLKTIKNNI